MRAGIIALVEYSHPRSGGPVGQGRSGPWRHISPCRHPVSVMMAHSRHGTSRRGQRRARRRANVARRDRQRRAAGPTTNFLGFSNAVGGAPAAKTPAHRGRATGASPNATTAERVRIGTGTLKTSCPPTAAADEGRCNLWGANPVATTRTEHRPRVPIPVRLALPCSERV